MERSKVASLYLEKYKSCLKMWIPFIKERSYRVSPWNRKPYPENYHCSYIIIFQMNFSATEPRSLQIVLTFSNGPIYVYGSFF